VRRWRTGCPLYAYTRPRDPDRPVVCLDETSKQLAESDLAFLPSQCLERRIPDKQAVIDEVAAWVRERNKAHAVAKWRFTTDNAPIKLKTSYPSL
jgi:hypothetical protein